ncbi:hypothetical protein IQ254_25595 [Nodosilinea sp. LEGE 07088]|uniref:hypothetical protein n=1 Tax=Nodosilinea sp. LEGE 07088 TaxID=2777968 RepID=UPI00187EBC0C|nr:hypothetical protein [Nodosilinea sp. LEGE 07088]MBE9140533.1 hypothetical protein [Nodosilinea sp. LEGE 07088]
MNVEVVIVVSVPPTEKDLDDLSFAASRLTNKQDSTAVNVKAENDQFLLATTFTMKTAAQYKVVDHISKEFEFSTVGLEGYQEMIISFPW